MRKRIGVTGQRGFIGTHLINHLIINKDCFEHIPFERSWFDDDQKLDDWVRQCDVIVHLAGMNRHENPQVIYDTNIELAEKLVAAFERTNVHPHVLFSSSTQEERDNLYGQSKLCARSILQAWATNSNALFTGMVIPNVFGPFGKPFYNSGIATFCYQLTHGQTPHIIQDGELKLIYVDELVKEFFIAMEKKRDEARYLVPHSFEAKVSEILGTLTSFNELYLGKGEIPPLQNPFHLRLFNTFRSYIEPSTYFPRPYTQHTDNRGSFVELIRLHDQGQVSFSTTHPGITRGNHFHTRKVERFAVIKGKARISMRMFRTMETLHFDIDASIQPAYVDMPVWYTHNITNVGNEGLITIFWINEFYNPQDPDTYLETV